MSASPTRGHSHPHPAPARDQVSTPALFFGVMAGPAGWIVQHLVDYGLSAYACYPGTEQLLAPAGGWGGVRWAVVVATLLGLALAGAGGWIAYGAWRRTRHEHAGGHHDLLEAGSGRSRFFAISGVLASLLFAGAILFDGVMLAGSPLCRG